jgi:hypothetical protein
MGCSPLSIRTFLRNRTKSIRAFVSTEAFYEMSVVIVMLQVLEQAWTALHVSEKELAKGMRVQRTNVTRLFNASHPNPTLDTISDILRAPGFQAEIKISPASPEDAPTPFKATFVPVQCCVR